MTFVVAFPVFGVRFLGDAGGSWGAAWEAAASSPAEYQQAALDTMLGVLRNLVIIGAAVAALALTLHVISRILAGWRSLAIRSALGAPYGHLFGLVMRGIAPLLVTGSIAGLAAGAGVLALLHFAWPVLLSRPPLVIPVLAAVALSLAASFVLVAALVALLLLILQRGIRTVSELQGAHVTSGSGLMLVQRALAVLQVAGLLVVTYGCALLLAQQRQGDAKEDDAKNDDAEQATVTWAASGTLAQRAARIAALGGAVTSPDAVIGMGKQVRMLAWCPECHVGLFAKLVSSGDARVNAVSPDALRAMHAPLSRATPLHRGGRYFSAGDTLGAPRVAILNVAASYALFPGANALGHELIFGPRPDAKYRVVGVVDFEAAPVFGSTPNDPLVFVPIAQHPPATVEFIGRASVWDSLRAAIADVKSDAPQLGRIRAVNDRLHDFIAPVRWFGVLFTGVASTATGLAAWSLVSVMTQMVELREREIGIRMALGADRGMIARWTAMRTVWTTVTGLAIGFSGGRWLGVLLHGDLSRENDLAVLGTTTLAILALGLLASLRPAWKASRLDPAVSWRTTR